MSVESWIEKKIFDTRDVMRVLPHRYPFLLIDRVLDLQTGKPVRLGMSEKELFEARKGTTVRALKNISVNEMPFMGHFPTNPIFPGVLTVEAMAQAASFTSVPFVACLNQGQLPALRVALAGFDGVRFRKPIVPGDQLKIQATVTHTRGPLWTFESVVEVDGKKVAEGEFLAHLEFGAEK